MTPDIDGFEQPRGASRPARWLVLAAIAVVAAVPTAAQFRPLGVTNGLGAKVVPDMMVDRDGFLWVASREGLYRYDGYRAVRFEPDDADPQSISDIDLRMLYQDSQGVLWVATNTGGLNRFDPATGEFQHYRHDSSDPKSLSYDSVYGMAEGPAGDLWVGTQIGLNRFDRRSGTFTRFVHDPDDPTSLSTDYVYTVFLDRSGTLWVATVGGGLSRWQPQNSSFARYDLAALTDGPQGLNDVFAVVEDATRTLWVGTRLGLIRADPTRDTWERHRLVDDLDDGPLVTSIQRTSDGSMWIGTLAHGLFELEPASGEVRQLPATGYPPGVPIMSLAESPTGGAFVGSWGEGVYFASDPDRRSFLLDPETTNGGLRYRNVTDVMGTSAPGQPWVGSFGGGPQRLDVDTATATVSPDDPPVLSTEGVMAFEETPDGHVFAGTTDGLWELEADGTVVHFYKHDPDDPESLGRGYVTTLLATDDQLWVGVGGSGLCRLQLGDTVFDRFWHDPRSPTSLSGDYVTSLLEHPRGQLWVGTRSSGLNVCRMEDMACRRFLPDPTVPDALSNHHVTDLFLDSADRVWVATDGGGLLRAVLVDGGFVTGFERWGVDEGLISNHVLALREDDDRSLLVATREGLTRIDPDTELRVPNSIPMTGLPVESFNAAAADRDERFLYFGAVNGLLVLPVGTAFEPGTPPPVRVTSIERPGGADDSGSRVSDSPEFSIDYQDVVQVEFAVLDFTEVPHRYQYRLRSTSPWNDLGTRNSLAFAGLSPGHHTLEIRGRGTNGLWSEAPPLKLEVVPPFWMTGWFRGVVAAGLLLLVLGAHTWRMSALERRNRELTQLTNEREQALERVRRSEADLREASRGLSRLARQLETAEELERRRISHELHDELGQTLTAAKINLQLIGQQLEDGASAARIDDAVAMMDDMIARTRALALRLRPPLLDEAGLKATLEHHLADVAERTGIPIDLDVDPELPALRSETELVLFRVIQESVNNALRHAEPRRISVTLATDDGFVVASIADDGRGFDVDEVGRRASRGEHLGLLGMRERVRNVDGRLDIASEPGRGTRVEVRVAP